MCRLCAKTDPYKILVLVRLEFPSMVISVFPFDCRNLKIGCKNVLQVKFEDKHQGAFFCCCCFWVTVSGKSKYVKWCRKSIWTVRTWHFLQMEKRVQRKLSVRVLLLHLICHKKVTTHVICYFYLNANNFFAINMYFKIFFQWF